MSLTELETVELPLARELLFGRHEIRRQIKVPGGRIDIFDYTADELIECKARGDVASLAAAAAQLHRYKRHFPGPQLAIAVVEVDVGARWFADVLEREGIRIIELVKGVGI